MTRPMHPALRPLLAISLACAAFALAASDASAADCPAHSGAIKKAPLGRVWHTGKSLYACTTVYGHRPRARRLGPWDPKSRVAFDGVDVAWTTPLTRDGVRSDRVWAGNADDGSRWLVGSPLLPSGEERIQSIIQTDQGAAWVTRTGDVVLALRSPNSAPVAVGTLPGPLAPVDNLLLVGSWPSIPAAQLAATAKLVALEGDGDECGGSNPYELTVQPDPASPAVGATWWGDWTSTNCD